MSLLDIAKEIRDIIKQKQDEINLSFVEDTHTYFIKDSDGNITTDYPSVSTVIGQFYEPFPEHQKSLELSEGDIFKQDQLLKQWRETSSYANNKGSRVHYMLETKLLEQYGSYKEVRQPIFECDEEQLRDSDIMIEGGLDFIDLMHKRGAILLDTEMVLGSQRLKYTGQPDKMWLIYDKNGDLGIVCSDWKTNKPKNFEVQPYTSMMLPPFQKYHDTALSHYMIQLPLYARLLLDMLKGTKYENIKFLGCVIVHLLSEGVHKFVEYRIPKSFIDTVLTMDPLPRIKEVKEYKKKVQLLEQNRLFKLDMVLGFI